MGLEVEGEGLVVGRSDGGDGENIAFYGDNIYGSRLTGNRVYFLTPLCKNMHFTLRHVVVAALSAHFYIDQMTVAVALPDIVADKTVRTGVATASDNAELQSW